MKENIDDLKARILRESQRLTESQKKIANFILQNPQILALSSVRDLEAQLGTSKATIVRLAQALGYSGFQEMRKAMLLGMRKELDPLQRFKTIINGDKEKQSFFELIAEQSKINLEQTLKTLNPEDFKKAVSLIKKSNYVFTMGMAMSQFLAQITAYLLNRVSVKAFALTYGPLNFSEQIINIDKKDLIIAFSFPPYSPETIKAAEYAKEKEIPVVAITDKPTGQILPFSDIYFLTQVDSVTMSNSIMAPLALIYALAAQVGADLKSKTIKTIQAIDHVRKEHS